MPLPIFSLARHGRELLPPLFELIQLPVATRFQPAQHLLVVSLNMKDIVLMIPCLGLRVLRFPDGIYGFQWEVYQASYRKACCSG